MLSRRLSSLLLIFVVTAAIAGGGWFLFVRPVTVRVAQEQQDVSVQVFGLGTVEARVLSKVGFKLSGTLIELRADEGDFVPKGMLLAKLDSREQEARVIKAKANVDQAEASLEKAKADVTKAQAALTNAQHISDRRQALVGKGTVSVETAETAQATMATAAADLGVANGGVAVARAVIGDARAQQQLESATLDLHALTTPYDALVIARQRELGSVVNSGEPVFTLIDPRTVWVLAYVDESKAGEIGVGQPAEIVLRSLPNKRFPGRVTRIEIESDRVNEERRIEATFDELPEDFHLGEQAEVYATTSRLKRAVLVPEGAVDELKSGRGMIWTVEEGRLNRRQVTFGHRMLDGRLEVAEGLPDRALVVAKPVSGLREGRVARIVAGSAP
jgi:HlyD family secretion protein